MQTTLLLAMAIAGPTHEDRTAEHPMAWFRKISPNTEMQDRLHAIRAGGRRNVQRQLGSPDFVTHPKAGEEIWWYRCGRAAVTYHFGSRHSSGYNSGLRDYLQARKAATGR
jgi:hypothetical protein